MIDIAIHYNTNLSVIKYDEESLIDLWKSFKQIFLSISCDGIGDVGEYQRTGFDTKRFEENLKTIKKYLDALSTFEGGTGIMYGFQYTTTIMNVYHIFDFIDYMFKNIITSTEQIDFTSGVVSLEFSLSQISKLQKDKIKTFNKHIKNTHKKLKTN